MFCFAFLGFLFFFCFLFCMLMLFASKRSVRLWQTKQRTHAGIPGIAVKYFQCHCIGFIYNIAHSSRMSTRTCGLTQKAGVRAYTYTRTYIYIYTYSWSNGTLCTNIYIYVHGVLAFDLHCLLAVFSSCRVHAAGWHSFCRHVTQLLLTLSAFHHDKVFTSM